MSIAKGKEFDSIEIYVSQIGNYPPLSLERQAELFAELKEVVPDRLEETAFEPPIEAMPTMEKLARCLYRLVIAMAGRRLGYGVSLTDLIQEGNIGLLRGIWKFDQDRGIRLSTYVAWWIVQSINRAVANQGQAIMLPITAYDRALKIGNVIESLKDQFGRNPTLSELSSAVDETESRLANLLEHRKILDSVTVDPYRMEERGAGDYGFFVCDKQASALDMIEDQEVKEAVSIVLNSLTAKEEQVIRLRFGFGADGHPHKLEEIGQKIGKTKERARQIQQDALKKLRLPKRADILREHIDFPEGRNA